MFDSSGSKRGRFEQAEKQMKGEGQEWVIKQKQWVVKADCFLGLNPDTRGAVRYAENEGFEKNEEDEKWHGDWV